MRAVIAFLAVVAVAQAAALMVLLGSHPGDTPLSAGSAATVTVYHTAAPSMPSLPPSTPVTVTPTADLPKDVAALQARVSELEHENAQMLKVQLRMRDIMVEKVRANEAMRNELASLRRNDRGRIAIEPDPAPGVADDELTVEQARARAIHLAMTRQATLWVIGHGLPLDGPWSGEQALGIEAAMRDETRRRDLVLRDFIRAALRDEAPANLDRLSGRQMMDNIIRPRMNGDFRTTQEFTPLKHIRLLRGETGLSELLGADAWTVRLGAALAPMRRRTHGDIARATTAEQAALIASKHLPIGSYRYSDGVVIEIGASK